MIGANDSSEQEQGSYTSRPLSEKPKRCITSAIGKPKLRILMKKKISCYPNDDLCMCPQLAIVFSLFFIRVVKEHDYEESSVNVV